MKVVLMPALFAAAAASAGARKAEKPTSATRPARPWGKSQAGLQISLSLPGKVTVGGGFACKVALRNIGQAPVKLPPAKAPPKDEAFGWLFVVQETSEGRKAFYTEKLPLVRGQKDWPAALPPGAIVELKPEEVSSRVVLAYRRGLKVIKGYPAAASAAPASARPPAERKLRQVLAVGQAKARMMLYLPRPGERALLLASNTAAVEVRMADFQSLPAAERKALVAGLLKRFDRDAWSAMAAHHEAVAIGRPIAADLIAAAKQRRRPSHSRLWLATAVADIRDERCAAALRELLTDASGGVRHVVAYHGPKQRDAKLDAAILEKFAGGKDTRGTALAVLGFLCFRRRVPERLLAASFESKDPRVRSMFASALQNHASDDNVSRLVSLLKDAEPRVRSSAAKALGAFGNRSQKVIGGLVAAMELPGDAARVSIAEALGKLTGKKMPYDPKADEKTKSRTCRAWKDWWAQRTRDDRKQH